MPGSKPTSKSVFFGAMKPRKIEVATDRGEVQQAPELKLIIYPETNQISVSGIEREISKEAMIMLLMLKKKAETGRSRTVSKSRLGWELWHVEWAPSTALESRSRKAVAKLRELYEEISDLVEDLGSGYKLKS